MVTPTGNTDPLGKPAVWATTDPGQLSLAVGATQFTVCPHVPGTIVSTILAGHPLSTGNSASATVMLNEQVEVFPVMSVAVYVITVTPIGKVDPLTRPAVCVSVINPGQLSEATGGDQDTTAEQNPGVLFTFILDGQLVNAGASLSDTVTVNEQVAVLPLASVAR